jgi:hypothetical protein
MTGPELHDLLDVELSRVVREARRRAQPMTPIDFAGYVSGFLIKTGIKIAHKHGAPRSAIEDSVSTTIASFWEQAS